jgi:alanyl-tRNA synthetase
MFSSKKIRKDFIDFFKDKEHIVVDSTPVIPADDPTLLFINAGMNQFKNIFLGLSKSKIKRACDSQKCIRAGGKHNDLEEVGRDGYHHTFFEMLGNWSFADYYKEESIKWAWELITEVWKLPKNKLYATVHISDQEAYNIWKEQTDIEPSHISYHGDKDNFWEMGDVGPCGPSSEIHFDRGEEFCNLRNIEGHKCKVNGDCHRYIELWNLVFIQYKRLENGELVPLENKYIDTGAGLERLCQILQGKNSNYATDLFVPIIEKIAQISNQKYFDDERGVSHRIIADHIRALTFAISDGGMPSNEGRGYVLRRILRRAARHGHLLNMKKPFLYKLIDVVVDIMGEHYTELKERVSYIEMIIKAEEERFNLTMEKGILRFNEICQKTKDNNISGKDAFMLYDTFGFPLDLTEVMAEERGFKIDFEEFNYEMKIQKERARNASKFKTDIKNVQWINFTDSDKTNFVGYEKFTVISNINSYSINDKNQVEITLAKTPFYAEQGGQIGDKGRIFNDGMKIEVYDVKKINDKYIHFGNLKSGEINDNPCTCQIDLDFRKSVARNHSATHLLQAALRSVLGEHIHQKGSFVTDKSLRFDFTHFQSMSEREIDLVEKIINNNIRKCLPVITEIKSAEEAKKSGAMALFGEKYGAEVRVVSMGNESKELCGGTHVNYTGEIGIIKIISETSSSAGVRRIEAITGKKAEEYFNKNDELLKNISLKLSIPTTKIEEKISKLLEEHKALLKEISSLKSKISGDLLDNLIAKSKKINDVTLVTANVNVDKSDDLKNMGDQIISKIGSGIGVLFAEIKNKVSIIVVVSKDLVKKYPAGKIISQISEIVGGKGGGRPNMAMAGGKDVTKIDLAIKQTATIIKSFNN